MEPQIEKSLKESQSNVVQAQTQLKKQTNPSSNETIDIVKTQAKHYFFESETKRLKAYYAQHKEELLNRKILFNNSVALVKFFGGLAHEERPKNSQNELWIGAEWDQQGRGKHNGTVNGYEYFKTGQKQGSLLKFQKVEFGYKLQTALFKRYFRAQELHHAKDIYQSLKSYKQQLKKESQSETTKDAKCEQLMKKKVHKIEYDTEAYVNTLKSKKIMIEFVGFDQIWSKINNLQKLQSISLSDSRICDFGPSKHLNSLLSNLRILSLENNLLTHWDQIFQLGLQLPHLTELSVAYNHIAQPEQCYQNKKQIKIIGHGQSVLIPQGRLFPSLKVLILIQTNLSWKTLFKNISAFDQIQELILCKNAMTDIQNINTDKFNYLEKLRFLNLEQNGLNSFDGVRKFGVLPKLKKMTLNKNNIESLGRDFEGFENLQSLSLQANNLHNPVCLYQISRFKNLQALNIKHNPMSDKMGKAHIRMRAIAEVTKLKFINGSQLRKYERKDCQIYYMRESFREYFDLKKVPDYDYDFEDFTKYCEEWHPNVLLLIKKFGNPYVVEEKKEIQQIIKEEVKTIQMKKGTGMIQASLQIKGSEPVKKKLPLTWTLSSLRNFIAKTMKVPVGIQRLTCTVEEGTQPQQMTQDHKPLNYYNLRNGSFIQIQITQ